MRLTTVVLLLIFSINSSSEADEKALERKIVNLEYSLQRTNAELKNCYKEIEQKSDNLVSKAWSSFDRCIVNPSEKQFKSFVSELLRQLDLEAPMTDKQQLKRDLIFTADSQDVQLLRRFVLIGDVKSFEIQEIILDALRRKDPNDEYWFKRGFGWANWSGTGNRLHPIYGLIGIVVVFGCVVVVPLVLGTRHRTIALVLFCYCLLHIWSAEYWKLVAKKEAVMAKYGLAMMNCRLEKKGYAGSFAEFLSGLWNGVEDPCEEYYKAAMVDPFLEVNLLHALVESVNQLLTVLGGLGQALGQFVTNFLAALPLVWKLPCLLIGAVLVLMMCMVCCGFKFSSILFSIESGNSYRLGQSSRGLTTDPVDSNAAIVPRI